jgi:hypothetical protein
VGRAVLQSALGYEPLRGVTETSIRPCHDGGPISPMPTKEITYHQ